MPTNPRESLTLNTYKVRSVQFGPVTEFRDGILTVDRVEITAVAESDPRVNAANVEIVHPGEATRVTAIKDVIEPRVKTSGPGQVYPGVAGRPVTTVGVGKTNRLAGVAVTPLSPIKVYELPSPAGGMVGGAAGPGSNLFDMSGPGAAASPYGSLHHVCISLDVSPLLHLDDQNETIHAAALRVSDLLAKTTLEAPADETEAFSNRPLNDDVPSIVYVACMNSPQHYANSLNAYGVAIYGLTRQTPPWVLGPTEILDGAICGSYSYEMANNPVVMGLLRKHRAGECNFLGVITIRTRWTSQAEKNVQSGQTARIARDLGATGAIVTWDAGGNDFMEVARVVQACERAGIDTVLLTGEEDPANEGPALLEPLPEMEAVVSTGIGANMWFERTPMPAVDRVVGAQQVQLNFGPNEPLQILDAKSELATLQSEDHYGFGFRSCFNY